jgi:hypothetical protein
MLSCDATLDEDCMQSIMASGFFFFFFSFFLELQNMLSCDATLDEDCMQCVTASRILFGFFLITFFLTNMVSGICPPPLVYYGLWYFPPSLKFSGFFFQRIHICICINICTQTHTHTHTHNRTQSDSGVREDAAECSWCSHRQEHHSSRPQVWGLGFRM